MAPVKILKWTIIAEKNSKSNKIFEFYLAQINVKVIILLVNLQNLLVLYLQVY